MAWQGYLTPDGRRGRCRLSRRQRQLPRRIACLILKVRLLGSISLPFSSFWSWRVSFLCSDHITSNSTRKRCITKKLMMSSTTTTKQRRKRWTDDDKDGNDDDADDNVYWNHDMISHCSPRLYSNNNNNDNHYDVDEFCLCSDIIYFNAKLTDRGNAPIISYDTDSIIRDKTKNKNDENIFSTFYSILTESTPLRSSSK